jgi:hypothetical protein
LTVSLDLMLHRRDGGSQPPFLGQKCVREWVFLPFIVSEAWKNIFPG